MGIIAQDPAVLEAAMLRRKVGRVMILPAIIVLGVVAYLALPHLHFTGKNVPITTVASAADVEETSTAAQVTGNVMIDSNGEEVPLISGSVIPENAHAIAIVAPSGHRPHRITAPHKVYVPEGLVGSQGLGVVMVKAGTIPFPGNPMSGYEYSGAGAGYCPAGGTRKGMTQIDLTPADRSQYGVMAVRCPWDGNKCWVVEIQ